MAEDVARAVGAGGRDVTINGKPVRLRPLSVKELCEIERDCVRQYRIQYLNRLKETADLLPNGQEHLRTRIEETATWGAEDLPRKEVYDASKLHITPSIEIWLRKNTQTTQETIDRGPRVVKQLVMTALDQGVMTPAEYERLTGEEPVKMKTSYVNWWVTADFEGMVSMLYNCLRDQGITREDVYAETSRDESRIQVMSRDIESLTAPSTGNG